MSGQTVTFRPEDIDGAAKPQTVTFSAADIETEPVPTPADTWGQSAVDVAKGVGKGALNTVIGLGDLAGKARLNPLLGPIGKALPDLSLNRLTGGTPEMFQSAREEFATPTNLAQQIGAGAEQIGEFFVPSGMAARGAKTAARVLPKFLARAGTEALSAGAVTAAQGGDPMTAAATAGAFPLAGRALSGMSRGLKRQAGEQVMQALGPTKERFKAIAGRRAPEVLKRGLTGNREKLQAQAVESARAVGRQIDEALTEFAKRPVSTKPIVDALEAAKAPSIDATAGGMPVVLDSRAVNQIQRLQNLVEQYGPDVSVESLVKIRRAWDAVVNQAGGYAHRAGGAIGLPLKEQSEAWAKREGASAIRRVLAKDVPELDKLNKEFAFWADIRDVVSQTIKRTKPQEKGLIEKMVGGSAAGGTLGGMLAHGAGALSSGGAAIITGLTAKNLVAAFKSPRWKMVSARLKTKLADALESGNQERINLAVGRVVAATSGRQ